MSKRAVPGLACLLASTLIATQQPTPALSIAIVEGREAAVQVQDENHRPVAGAVVTFLLPDRGAGATFANGARSATMVTDLQGRATARGLRPNRIEGRYSIRVNAAFEGRTASAVIEQANVLRAGGHSARTLTLLAIAGGAAAAVGVAVTRGGGKAPAAAPAAIVITPGAPNVGGPR